MSKILVFGHQNPDTDAIGAAIAFANLQKELGKDAEAVALRPIQELKTGREILSLASRNSSCK